MVEKRFYVYILTNFKKTVLYTGVTSNLAKRLEQHKNPVSNKTFTSKYRVNRLVYVEFYDSPTEAILREKQIKSGSRVKKIKLIESINPNYNDLALTLEL